MEYWENEYTKILKKEFPNAVKITCVNLREYLHDKGNEEVHLFFIEFEADEESPNWIDIFDLNLFCIKDSIRSEIDLDIGKGDHSVHLDALTTTNDQVIVLFTACK